jgi:hypothetical protein
MSPFPDRRLRCCRCTAFVDVAPTDQGVLINMCFAFLNCLEIARHEFTFEDGLWWCRYCIRRKRLIRVVPVDEPNVTSSEPATGTKL